ncbi:hypothetical protein [Miltoncostaea marina]|uniref:hypothetical protein n=1 Tax=Miltoncostaea marina TaxID=2843215 RepID=UPI001C3D48EF|nr:hypothetical protein [Miltoncostaea marina]
MATTSTAPRRLQSSVDLALAVWFVDAIRVRAEREGLTPPVLQALRDGHRDLGAAIDEVALEAGLARPPLRDRARALLDRRLRWPAAVALFAITVIGSWLAIALVIRALLGALS